MKTTPNEVVFYGFVSNEVNFLVLDVCDIRDAIENEDDDTDVYLALYDDKNVGIYFWKKSAGLFWISFRYICRLSIKQTKKSMNTRERKQEQKRIKRALNNADTYGISCSVDGDCDLDEEAHFIYIYLDYRNMDDLYGVDYIQEIEDLCCHACDEGPDETIYQDDTIILKWWF